MHYEKKNTNTNLQVCWPRVQKEILRQRKSNCQYTNKINNKRNELNYIPKNDDKVENVTVLLYKNSFLICDVLKKGYNLANIELTVNCFELSNLKNSIIFSSVQSGGDFFLFGIYTRNQCCEPYARFAGNFNNTARNQRLIWSTTWECRSVVFIL